MKVGRKSILLFATMLLVVACGPAMALGGAKNEAADQEAELAKKLQNPVASLISVPLQNNWDFGIGSKDAMRYTLNVQPVIPFSIDKEWNLITRTILPFIYAESPVAGGDSKSGLGDIVQSFFLSPKAPTSGGWIWAAGPVLLYPSATDSALGGRYYAEKPDGGPDWGLRFGVTFLFPKQLTAKLVVDWVQAAKTGAVAELEAGWNINRHWAAWLMGGGRLWGEGVPSTYDTRVTIGVATLF